MVHKAAKFTPQVLLSAPRRSAGVPNPSGTWVLYTSSAYSFDTHKKSTELRALNVDSGDSHLLAKDDNISDINWLNDDEFVCLQAEKDGTTSVYVASVEKVIDDPKGKTQYIAGKIDGPAGNLKVKQLDEEGDEFAFVVSAETTAGDATEIYNPEKTEKTHSTGRLYSSLYARHWDRWETKEKNALWAGKLSNAKGKFKLSGLTNVLRKLPGVESPVRPFGGTDNFDVSQRRIILVTKDQDLNPALNTKMNVWILHVDFSRGEVLDYVTLIVKDLNGAISSPIFSPDGHSAAFLGMKTNGYESDKNEIYFARSYSPTDESSIQALVYNEPWDRSPSSINFSADGKKILATAEENGVTKVFEIDPFSSPAVSKPRALTHAGSIGDVYPLAGGHVFVSGSSLIDNSYFAIIDPLIPDSRHVSLTTWTNSNSSSGSKFGLKADQISSIWTPASNPKINKEVHSIVVRPSDFDSSKKYPVAYLIHGGPQGAWGDSWSTRWNPAVFAEQGYIVVTPNPTGSTGYGQAFTDAIRRNWGGDPYQDIVNVFEWVGKSLPEADNNARAVALGASYGGYMMNWIQGHDLGRKFKCLVCHDGITSFAGSALSTDELYFPFFDLGGTPWYNPGFKPAPGEGKGETFNATTQAHGNFGATTLSDWRKWDPSEHFANWATPQLVIHSAKDYRLPISDGLAAFNVLQARGVESQFLTFPDENHWVLKPENSLLWHKVVLNWINKYVGLDAFAEEEEGSVEFYGGVKKKADEAAADMPSQGRVEM